MHALHFSRAISRIELSITLDISTGNQPMNWKSALFNKFSELYNSTAEKTCDLTVSLPVVSLNNR
ncbi:hypothetical protein EWB00_003330 [Schistosoma japonicum]|uniref:Uncharacterized protein n=1 Tax=Schistosoma japonicum TaxID=6182 RepID=A0A4Z2D8W1_SCHJA|nr:hypothetical protein EWB00_003330 [Schistosoma japonicum]